MIYCVNIENISKFPRNLLAGQYHLRYRAIIERQGWDVPHYRQMEYDQYDTPSANYLVSCDTDWNVNGVSRLCRTDRPYMLKEVFSSLSDRTLPSSSTVLEGSRFCVEKTLPSEERIRISRELILAYLEYGLAGGIQEFIGVMLPIYWRNLFEKVGWEVDYYGGLVMLDNGQKVRAGGVKVSMQALETVRQHSQIQYPVLQLASIPSPLSSFPLEKVA